MEAEKGINFAVNVRVPHWTGCFGGTFEETRVGNAGKFLQAQKEVSPWLVEFLHNTNPVKIRCVIIERAPDAKNKFPVLAREEYVVDAILKQGDFFRDEFLWVGVVYADGFPLLPMRWQKRGESVGNNGFVGYRFNTARLNPGIVFKDEGGDILSPVHQGHFHLPEGIIVASLYCIEQRDISREEWNGINLANIAPKRSIVLNYRTPKKEDHY